MVHDPIRDEVYVAERGGGATLNAEPIRVSDTEELIQALIATGFPYDRAAMPEALELFGHFAATTRGMRRLGSAALDLCYVASGRLDGYYERGIWPWDLAAGSVMVEEAGGKLTNYRGDLLDLDGREIVASNGPLHPTILWNYRLSSLGTLLTLWVVLGASFRALCERANRKEEAG